MVKEGEIEQIVIEDLLCRFIMNLPKEEQTTDRLFFHIQAAHWFYSDFYVGNTEIINAGCKVPACNFKTFAKVIYKHCPFLKPYYSGFEIFFYRFNQYISQIPVYGGIILNANLDKVLLVTNYKNTFYSFPKGKINQNETGIECAVREVWEEVGVDISKFISEKDFIEFKTEGNKTQKMYVVHGVDENLIMKTNTRCEIGRIEWVPLSEMEEGKVANTNIFRKITTFIRPLKLWIRDFTSARAKEKEAETTTTTTTATTVISLPVLRHHYTETQNKKFSEFSLRFEEISAGFEKRLNEMDEVVEESQKENPFLSFKLDHQSLREAFTFKL